MKRTKQVEAKEAKEKKISIFFTLSLPFTSLFHTEKQAELQHSAPRNCVYK
jgi:hypothetical protein